MVGQNVIVARYHFTITPHSSLLFEERQYSPTFEVVALVFLEEA